MSSDAPPYLRIEPALEELMKALQERAKVKPDLVWGMLTDFGLLCYSLGRDSCDPGNTPTIRAPDPSDAGKYSIKNTKR